MNNENSEDSAAIKEQPETKPPVHKTTHKPAKSWQRTRSALATIGILLIAPAIAVVLTLYVFQSYQVDGPSMQETLHNNDRLIVWKMARSWARITGHEYVPNRGDVIVFTETGLANYGDSSNTKQLIKRVIGLPGDRVVVKDNFITIYNKDHPKGFDPAKTLDYGKAITQKTSGNIDITLGKDQLFVCGDNRGDSLDSRIFGPIDAKDVIGKLVLRILPLSDAERF
ncbi:MAG: signal peptidase I [Candidatus Saccharimonadales bacterium]